MKHEVEARQVEARQIEAWQYVDIEARQVKAQQVEAWRDKLSAMTADEIAALCREEEIVGVQCVSNRCAIAQLITKKTGVEVAVDTTDITICSDVDVLLGVPSDLIVLLGGSSDSIVLEWSEVGPADFIENFDSGEYPELIYRQLPKRGEYPDITHEERM